MRIHRNLNYYYSKIIYLLIFPGFIFKFIDNILQLRRPSLLFWFICCIAVFFLLKKSHLKSCLYFIFYLLIILLSFNLTNNKIPIENFIYVIILYNLLPFLIGLTFETKYINIYLILKALVNLNILALIYCIFENYLTVSVDRSLLQSHSSGLHDITIAFEIGNLFGAFLCITFYLLVISKNSLKIQLEYFSYASISLIILIFFGSRTSLFSALLIIAIIIIIKIKEINIYFIILLLLIAFSNLIFISEDRLIFLLEFNRLYENLFGNYSCDLGEGGSFAAHLTLYKEAIRLFIENPFFGIGVGNYGYRYCGYSIDLASPHSILLQLLVESGMTVFIPTLIFLAFIFVKTIIFIKNGPINYSIIGILYAYIFFQLQFSGNLYIDFHYYIILGLFINLLNSHRTFGNR